MKRPARIPSVEEARRAMDRAAAAQLIRRNLRKSRRGLLTPEARRAFDFLEEQLREFEREIS